MLCGVEPGQAKRVRDEMVSVEQAGGKLDIFAAAGRSMGSVSWPAPPTIAGRDLETFR